VFIVTMVTLSTCSATGTTRHVEEVYLKYIYIRQDSYNQLIMTSETPRIGWKHPILVGYQDANLPRWCYNIGLWSDVNELNNLDTQPTT
jgi:hypothetical protein